MRIAGVAWSGGMVLVAVVGFLCEIQSTILHNFGVADIAFKGLNDVKCLLG